MERMQEAWAESPQSAVEIAVDDARGRLASFNAANPELRRFTPIDNIRSAGRVLGAVPGFLRDNSQLVKKLMDTSETVGQGRTSMLVLPDMPLVLASTGSMITALAPVLSCTHTAIAEEFAHMPSAKGRYDVLISDGGLDDTVWESTTRGQRYFDFNPKTMKPADYIGLVIKTFTNEPFRLRFKKGDPTFTPLK